MRAGKGRERGHHEFALTPFFELSADILGIASLVDGRWKRVNPAMSRMLGWSEQELLAMPYTDLVQCGDHVTPDGTAARSGAQDAFTRFENRVRCKDGGHRWISWSTALSPDAALVYCTGRDITQEREAEETLRIAAQRDRFRATLSDALRTIGDARLIQSAAMRVLCEHLHASRVHYGEITPDGACGIVHADHSRYGAPSVVGRYRLDDYGPCLASRLRAGRTVVVDDVAADARLTPAQKAATAALGVAAYAIVPLVRHGRAVALLAVHHARPHAWSREDLELISETAQRTWGAVQRAQAEQALRASEERYRALFEAIDEGFCVLELIFDDAGKPLDYRFVETNPAFARHTGLLNAVGRTARELVPDLEARWFEMYGRIATTGRPARFEDESPAMGRWFDIYAFRVGRPEERRVALLFNDITERKRAQQLAEERRAELETVYNAITDGVVVFDAAGRTVLVNEAEARLCGYETAEAMKGDFDRFTRAFELTRLDGSMIPTERWPAARVLRGESVVDEELVVRRRDTGRECIVSFSGQPVHDAQGRLILAVTISRDITERKRAEQALRKSEARIRAVFDALVEGVFFLNPEGVVEVANDAVHRIYGIDAMALLHPESELRKRIVKRDGTPFPPEEQPAIVALRTGRAVRDVEMGVPAADGSLRWRIANAQPVRDDAGTLLGAVASFFDITARKRAEEALREADRRKDEFLATLAHELRNPLAAIRNAAAVLGLQAARDPNAQRAVGMIERQLQQMVRLIDDLLDVSRITTGKLQLHRRRTTLQSMVHQAVEAIHCLHEHDTHAISVTLPGELLYMDCDATRLTQVFSNLLDNACKFTDRTGRVDIEARRRGEAEVTVSVRDSGVGIPREHLGSVFEMFSQVRSGTDRTQHGLGIGLALARTLVEMHGGTIEARSEGPGLGSEFIVFLPIEKSAQPAAGPDVRRRGDARFSPCRILVVDDNHDAAESMQMLLKLAGHDVAMANSGAEALAQAAAFAPDVVLLDVGMPGMNGYEACRAMRERPRGADMIIVALTGWGQEADRRASREAGFDAHLVKPVAQEALMEPLADLAEKRRIAT